MSISELDRLRAILAAVRRRWFATVALHAIGTGAIVAAVPGLAALLVYRWLHPQGGALLLLAALALLVSAAGIIVIVRRIEPRPNDHRVARFIEERAERAGRAPFDDAVVSAVQAQESAAVDDRAAFAELVVRGAVRRLEGVSPGTLIPRIDVQRAAAIAAGGLAVAIATLVATAPALSHAVQTARLLFFPQAITVEVLPGHTKVVAGQPLVIRARLQAGGADLEKLSPSLVVTDGKESRTVAMARTASEFEYRFESVDRSFQYKVTVGRAASSEYAVRAIFAPRVQRIELQYAYPSFSGLKPRIEEDGGDIYAPVGTRVRMRIHADKPIVSADLSMSGKRVSLTGAGTILETELLLQKDDSYRIAMLDEDGLKSDGDSEYFIRMMDDRPPDVRIMRPTSDQGITSLEEVPIEARAEDDYGVASLELVYAVGGGAERSVPFVRTSADSTQANGSFLLAAEDLKVRPGDVITYYARARDVGRGKPSSESRSDMFFLEVRPFNEEFVAAQSQAGAGGGDPQIESLIDAQKEIINATWNIERRSAAGRSADDMKSVAQAQAELKSRVERLLGASRGRRGREPIPQQVTRRPQPEGGGADPMAAALEAMTRAVEQLATGKTKAAIPHEMAALNSLTQMQAEVRRRQVSQQQANASGGGFGNRQSQDLSALFDKELQRQQRTNYEQRSQVEERPEGQKSDDAALDKVRELARRQEELSRQQREAARLAEAERRRQLDRLMREQQELQRQAEQLSRELSGQSGQQQPGQQQSGQQQSGQQQSGQQQSGQPQSPGQQSGQSSGQSQSGQAGRSGSQEMREAVEQMRQAAGELKREDTDSAAKRGERAAQQLRDLEERLRGGSADARGRAAADLQSEAQQILQEQRRIAGEADRLERGSEGSGADARRRLAADKDRLSERVDALQREAQRQGSSNAKGTETTRAREAAQQLEQGKVGERMRQAAQGLREGQQAPSGQGEQQIARTLESVVEKLGGSASAAAEQAAAQLEASRDTRAQLDALEAKLRDAQGRGNAGDAEKLREQYEQELRRVRDGLSRNPSGASASEQRGGGGSTPEQHEYSRSAPGTEAFKQDRTGWESLRQDVNRALEARDAAASQRLAKSIDEDRFSAGGSERVPEKYRKLVARYYESLGKPRK